MKLFFSDRYQRMKLFIPVSIAISLASSQSATTAKTLLQEIEDVLKDDEDKDIGYSNSKLSNTHFVRIFPRKLQYCGINGFGLIWTI